MTKKILIIAVSLILTHTLSAQKYNRGWELGVGGGVQMLFSSDADNLAFKQRLTPSLSLSAGKWISPIWGLRLQAGAYSLNGYSTTDGIYVADPLNNGLVYGKNDPVRDHSDIYPDGSYRHYLRYVNIHGDLQMSLLRLISKQKRHRWDIIPAVGLGYFQTLEYEGTPAVSSISTNFSLMGKYAINKRLSVNLEASAIVLPDAFDGRISGQSYENIIGATLGLTYHFKSKKSKQEQTAQPGANRPVRVEVRRDTIIEYVFVRDTIEVEVEKFISTRKGTVSNLASIQFGLGREKPLASQEIHFANIANFMATHPEATLTLEGYGDKERGSAKENLRISGERTKNVRNILINRYKIDGNKISVKVIGAEEQPYKEQAWNRVVLVKVME